MNNFSVLENSYECLLVKAAVPGLGDMLVVGIYRPPTKPLAEFTEFVTGILEYTSNYRAVFTGDSNVETVNILIWRVTTWMCFTSIAL